MKDMTREIKFRAKRLDNGEWVYGYLCENSKGEICIQEIVGKVVDGFAVPSRLHPVNPDTIGQYTGLKDKNGREIYEGDIIGWKSFIENGKLFRGIIKWYTDLASFAVYTSLKDIWPYETDLLKVTQIGCEVIGNIYDNPELLEEDWI